MTGRVIICILALLFFSRQHSFAQEIEITLGADEIALNEAFTITLTAKNVNAIRYNQFPNIKGLDKRGTNSSTSISVGSNGRRSSVKSITMQYSAREEGTYTLNPFSITINGTTYKSPGKTIKVGAPKQGRKRGNNPFGSDPFDDFFNRKSQPQEYMEIKADAFLALTTNKKEVYRGEGITTTLAFYVSNKNRADLSFHDLGKQINDIIKKIKPQNCWEENFNIDNITGESITLGDESYTQYKIYEATFFPLNTENITFPSIPLEMIKYKVAKNPSFFGQNRQEDFQTFYTQQKTVIVKELPEHPLKESVSVGNFKLREEFSKKELKTGESFNFNFDIGGIGNISAITPPVPLKNEDIEIYDPETRQNTNKGNGRISGTKEFKFYGIPNEPGTYKLSDYVSWVFFNPSTASYDTLIPSSSFIVTGESKKNQFIMSNDMGTFYDRIDFENNELASLNSLNYTKIALNVLIILMLGVGIVFLIKGMRVKRKPTT